MAAIIQRAVPDAALLAERRKTRAIATLSFVVSLCILNRWWVTSLGLESFGRIWHLYVNYFEFGFNRRSLEGTIVYLTGLRSLFSNAYQFGFFWQSLKLALLVFLTYRLVQRRLAVGHLLLKCCIFFSPAFIWHYAYVPGNPDLFIVLIAVGSLLVRLNRVVFALVLCLGVLAHESFAFLMGALALIYEVEHAPSQPAVVTLRAVGLAAPAAVVSVGLFHLSHLHPPDPHVYERHMAALLGVAAYKHKYWSGYWELFSGAQDFVRATSATLSSASGDLAFLILPLLYVLTLAGLVGWTLKGESAVTRILMGMAVLLPLAIFYFADDYYRWISFSGTLSLLAICVFWRRASSSVQLNSPVTKVLLLALLSLSVLGPIGSNPISDPFPVARFVAAALLRH